jgi:Uma2 family endonuclease
MGSPIKILPHYTYEDYALWEGKWEVIDGVPYAMSPAPVPRHQIVAGNLHAELRQQLKQCKKCQVSQPVDYIVQDDIILQPDILVLCQEATKKYIDFPPTLVAEILSPSTALKDRHTKFSIYESQGIRYYIIVDADKNEAEVYELIDKQYQLVAKGSQFDFNFNLEECKAAINFSQIW